MREIVFHLRRQLRRGASEELTAQAAGYPLRISAPSLEELQHEAREAVMAHFGAAHVTYRVRLRRAVAA